MKQLFIATGLVMATIGITGTLWAQQQKSTTASKPIVFAASDTSDALKGLKGVSVLVEDLPPDAGEIGLDKHAIGQRVELALRQNGIRVFSRDENQKILGRTYIYINANVLKSTFALSVSCDQDLYSAVSPGTVVTGVTIWRKGTVGTHGGESGYVLTLVDRYVETICNDFLKANPK